MDFDGASVAPDVTLELDPDLFSQGIFVFPSRPLRFQRYWIMILDHVTDFTDLPSRYKS